MERTQALRLLNELAAETIVGVDKDGDPVTQPTNPMFFALCRVAVVNLPPIENARPWADIQPFDRKLAPKAVEAREAWGQLFADIAQALRTNPDGSPL